MWTLFKGEVHQNDEWMGGKIKIAEICPNLLKGNYRDNNDNNTIWYFLMPHLILKW